MLRLNSSLTARFLVLPVAAGRSFRLAKPRPRRDIFQRLNLDGYSLPVGSSACSLRPASAGRCPHPRRLKIRPHICAALAAGATDKPGLNIR